MISKSQKSSQHQNADGASEKPKQQYNHPKTVYIINEEQYNFNELAIHHDPLSD